MKLRGSLSESSFLCLLVAALIIVFPGSVTAQVPDPTIAAMAPIPGVGHDYIGLATETVNPADGSFTFNLPLNPPPGRQLSFPFGVRYGSYEQYYLASNQISGSVTWYPVPNAPFQYYGWAYLLPSYAAQAYTQYSQPNPGADPPYSSYDYCDGTENGVLRIGGVQYSAGIQYIWPDPSNNGPINCSQGVTDGLANVTGTDVSFGATGPITYNGTNPAMQAVDSSGTTYQFPAYFLDYSGSSNSTPSWGLLATSITDKNGNQITYTGTQYALWGNGTGGSQLPTPAGGYKDTLGRQVVSWSGLGSSSGDQVTIAGLPANVVVKWETVNISFPETGHMVSGSAGNSNCWMGSQPTNQIQGVSEIDLPNGRKYSFAYDPTYGTVSQIIFPDGGYVQYVWGTYPSSSSTQIQWTQQYTSAQEFCYFVYDTPAITDRYVSDGASVVLHQHFTYTPVNWLLSGGSVPYWNTKQTTVETTDNRTGQTSYVVYNYVPVYWSASGYPWGPPVESSILYQDGSQNTLRTINKTWNSTSRLVGEQTILDNGQGITTLRCWGFYSHEVEGFYEYDFQQNGAKPSDPSCSEQPVSVGGNTLSAGLNTSAIGPLLRQTATVYHTFPLSPSPIEPDSVTVYGGSGNQLQQTTYAYDATSVVASGTATGLVAPPGSRGNATSVSRWLNTTNSNLTTTYSYFDNGQVQTRTDPCGNATCSDMTGSNHTTTYSYTDSYSSGTPPGQTNAYLTNIRDPLGHITTFTYGYADGQLTSSTDPNLQITRYKYNTPPSTCSYPDGLDRLSEIDYPDLGQTTYCYNDLPYTSSTPSNPSPSLTTTKAITSSVKEISTSAFDGLGHTVETILSTDPDGPTYTYTSYDGLGRPYKVYNPYRSSNDSTYGITTHTYDALGRTIQVAEPDGSTVNTAYSGNCTTVADEAGKVRETCTDSLGRLSEVEEPGVGGSPTPGSGTVTIGGSEQSTVAGATHSTGEFVINGGSPGSGCGGNTVLLYVNGAIVGATGYGTGSTPAGVASNLTSAINGSSSSPVTATLSGTTITVTSKATGSGTNYTLSGQPTNISPPCQTIFVSTLGPMSGGQDGQTVYDAGTVSVTVDGFIASASYGNGSTATSIASSLASGLSASGSPVTAASNGDTIALTATVPGQDSNYALTKSVSWNTQYFTNPSFTATPSGSSLTGGAAGTLGSSPLVTQYAYDPLNNLTCVVQQGTDTTQFTTCAAAPATWRPRSFVYDSLSRLTSATNPESGTITYQYDLNGNPSSKVAPLPNSTGTAQVTTNYSYDVTNRLTQKAYVGLSTAMAKFAYDGNTLTACGQDPPAIATPTNLIGRRSAMCSGNSGSSWSYDPMGRPLIESRVNYGSARTKLNASYTYWLDGSLKTLTYPSGDVVTYTVAGAGRPTQAIDSSNNYVTNATYTPHGALTSMLNGSAIATTNIYNNRLQPCWMYTTSGTALPTSTACSGTATTGNFEDLKYAFNWGVGDNGNVMGIVNNRDTTRSQVFAYDLLNRLQSASTTSTYATSPTNCWGEGYSIDAWGNLNSLSSLNSNYTGCTQETGFSTTANTSNQLPIASNGYDSAGNLTAANVRGLNYTYVYNAENQMTSATGVSTTSYVYDADGKRAGKVGSELYWYGVDGSVLDETDATGSLTNGNFSEYIYFGGRRIARRDSSGNVFYYFADHLGSSRTMAEVASGQTTATLCYDADFYPFGGERTVVNLCGQNYKFTGKERDLETGLDNFGKRYNASSMGRFMSPDPSPKGVAMGDPQSWNLYSYARNRPTRFVDVGGNWATDVHAQIVTYALQGYMSAGELAALRNEQYVMDKDQKPADQYKHAMRTPGQSVDAETNEMWNFVASKMQQAQQGVSGGTFTAAGLAALGDAIHTVEDYTSPMHTSASGEPMVWYGALHGGLAHWEGEASPMADWSRIGEAVRLTMAAFMQANPVEAANHGLTPSTFNAEANKRIEDYVRSFYAGSDFQQSNVIQEDAARQCALGNPAACGETGPSRQ